MVLLALLVLVLMALLVLLMMLPHGVAKEVQRVAAIRCSSVASARAVMQQHVHKACSPLVGYE